MFTSVVARQVCDNIPNGSSKKPIMSQWPPAMQLMGIGWYVATCIVFGVVGGVLLDGELGTGFVLTLVGLALGLASAGWGGYRMLQDFFVAQHPRRADDQEEKEPE